MPPPAINPARTKVQFSPIECIALGFGAGIVGVAAYVPRRLPTLGRLGLIFIFSMTLGEKVEQAFTNRPNSYVPGKTLASMLGLSSTYYNSHSTGVNWAMHWGQGIAAAGIRGLMSYYGLVGPFGSYMFMGVRLLIDQTLENWTGVGALPW